MEREPRIDKRTEAKTLADLCNNGYYCLREFLKLKLKSDLTDALDFYQDARNLVPHLGDDENYPESMDEALVPWLYPILAEVSLMDGFLDYNGDGEELREGGKIQDILVRFRCGDVTFQYAWREDEIDDRFDELRRLGYSLRKKKDYVGLFKTIRALRKNNVSIFSVDTQERGYPGCVDDLKPVNLDTYYEYRPSLDTKKE